MYVCVTYKRKFITNLPYEVVYKSKYFYKKNISIDLYRRYRINHQEL